MFLKSGFTIKLKFNVGLKTAAEEVGQSVTEGSYCLTREGWDLPN